MKIIIPALIAAAAISLPLIADESVKAEATYATQATFMQINDHRITFQVLEETPNPVCNAYHIPLSPTSNLMASIVHTSIIGALELRFSAYGCEVNFMEFGESL